MENIREIRKRHQREIEEFQKACNHLQVSDWVKEYWAPGHSTEFEVKVCETCEKIVAKRTTCRKCGKITENFKEGIGTQSRPLGSFYCPDCFERTEAEIEQDKVAL